MSAMYASRFPGRVRSLVLAGAPIDTDAPAESRRRIVENLISGRSENHSVSDVGAFVSVESAGGVLRTRCACANRRAGVAMTAIAARPRAMTGRR